MLFLSNKSHDFCVVLKESLKVKFRTCPFEGHCGNPDRNIFRHLCVFASWGEFFLFFNIGDPNRHSTSIGATFDPFELLDHIFW